MYFTNNSTYLWAGPQEEATPGNRCAWRAAVQDGMTELVCLLELPLGREGKHSALVAVVVGGGERNLVGWC